MNLAPLIDEVIGTARQLAEQNKNRLVVESQENLGSLTVDPMRLRQILLNLLSNACKFTKQGEVTLRVRKGGRRPQLDRDRRGRYRHRHDAGAAGQAVRGIHPGRFLDRAAVRRHRPRACHHPQARAHDGRRRDGDERAGQGLGLYRPPARQRGLAGEQLDRFRRPPFAQLPIAFSSSTTMPPRASSLSDHLKAEGFSVVTAAGGVEGLKLAKELRPTAITLDVMMPDLDGWSVLAALRQDPSSPRFRSSW